MAPGLLKLRRVTPTPAASASPSKEKPPVGMKERVAALRQLPRALGLVWDASPSGVVLMGVLALANAAVPVGLLYVGKLIVDTVVETARSGAPMDRLHMLVALEGALAAIQMLLSRVGTLARQRVGEKLSILVNVRILEKAVTLDLTHFEDSEFYDRLTRARREASYRPLDVVMQTFGLVQSVLQLTAYLATLSLLGPVVVALLLLAALPSFISELKFTNEAFRVRNWQSADSRKLMYTEHVVATDQHAKEVQLLGLGPYFLTRYRDLAWKIFGENWGVAVKRFAWGSVLSLLGIAAFYACYVSVAVKAAQGSITLGDLTLYALAFRQGQGAFQSVLSALGSMYEDGLYISNLFAFLATPVRAQPATAPVITAGGERGIRFDHVTFQYPGAQKPALEDVDLRIPAGESAALVGNNGAGKTTFIKLLTGLYAPTAGRVLLDGVDVRTIPPDRLRERFAIIFQDYNRYQLPFRDNVGLGALAHLADETRVQAAVDKGGAKEVLAGLKDGLDTQLGKWFIKGTDLSGGQWQKVALSRAFMRESADILVLDEPTATLDPEAEYAVFQRFKELTRGRTSFLISHRFSTVRLADRIYVMEAGKVLEHGTHAELLAAKGKYAHMFELQAAGYR